MKYDSDFNEIDLDRRKKYLNRSPPHRGKNKKHLNFNIRNIKNISDLNKLRSLDESGKHRGTGMTNNNKNRLNLTLNHPKNAGNFVFFSRK